MSTRNQGGSVRTWVPKIIPVLLLLGAFVFFVRRDREQTAPPGPEEVLLNMAVALGEGQVDEFLSCFGGSLRVSLQTILQENAPQEVSTWLRTRGAQIKGFAITEVVTIDTGRVMVATETVYEDRNTGQEFILELEGNEWRIVQSDFEAVQEWETDFGKPIWEVQ